MDTTLDIFDWENPFGPQEPKAVELPPASYVPRTFTPPDPEFGEDEPVAEGRPPVSISSAISKSLTAAFPMPESARPWPSGLTFDLSLGVESTSLILDRYSVSPEAYEHFLSIPEFRAELALHIKQNKEEGVTFQRKSAVLADDLLPDMFALVKDPMAPANVRADLFKSFVKNGNLEPKAVKEAGEGSRAPQINIQINM